MDFIFSDTSSAVPRAQRKIFSASSPRRIVGSRTFIVKVMGRAPSEPVPLISGKIYNAIVDLHAFRIEEFGLLPGTAEGKLSGERASGVDDAEAGDVVRVRVLVQRVSDGARHFFVAGELRDLRVGRDTAIGDLLDGLVDALRGAVCDQVIDEKCRGGIRGISF